MADEIYQISNDRLRVSLERLSGTFTSIQDSAGVEYLWQGDQAYWPRRAPICFPICGSLRDDKGYTRDGRELRMVRHGFAKTSVFEVAEHTASTMAFRLKDNADTFRQYPFHFEFYAKYALDGNRIGVTFEVRNTGDTAMPFFVGGHPGFNVPLLPGERFDDYFLEFERPETVSVPSPYGDTGLTDLSRTRPLLQGGNILPLSHELFRDGALQLEGLSSRRVTLKSASNPHGVMVEYPDFPVLLIWSSENGGSFVALEPWVGVTTAAQEDDIIDHKRYVQYAAPGEGRSYHFSITIS